MAKETVDVLIEGGKATAAPPLGPALGPKGVNIGKVVADINAKTADFKGMKVPVKVIIDSETKSYEIKIGTPPASQLIKQEAKIKDGAKIKEIVGDITFAQVAKVAKMKGDSLLGADIVAKSKEIMGTCHSMGISIEGKNARTVFEEMKKGQHLNKFK